ncbi:hypothetical protein JTE90_000085 [Oedothorax gibbosus]|uniref:Uncharacterized protein n=1 Tax=Oedothorax gibbosus TaxID=931172 RepID=A0AAV6UD61_9ARAC|nr:hypothetical protein JTE90_000085 [Oedothorax gibbosus]
MPLEPHRPYYRKPRACYLIYSPIGSGFRNLISPQSKVANRKANEESSWDSLSGITLMKDVHPLLSPTSKLKTEEIVPKRSGHELCNSQLEKKLKAVFPP